MWESPIGPAPELTQEENEALSFYFWDEDNRKWILKQIDELKKTLNT